jgi:hypothetical protein
MPPVLERLITEKEHDAILQAAVDFPNSIEDIFSKIDTVMKLSLEPPPLAKRLLERYHYLRAGGGKKGAEPDGFLDMVVIAAAKPEDLSRIANTLLPGEKAQQKKKEHYKFIEDYFKKNAQHNFGEFMEAYYSEFNIGDEKRKKFLRSKLYKSFQNCSKAAQKDANRSKARKVASALGKAIGVMATISTYALYAVVCVGLVVLSPPTMMAVSIAFFAFTTIAGFSIGWATKESIKGIKSLFVSEKKKHFKDFAKKVEAESLRGNLLKEKVSEDVVEKKAQESEKGARKDPALETNPKEEPRVAGDLGKAVLSTQREGQRDESLQGGLQKTSEGVVEKKAQESEKGVRKDPDLETNPKEEPSVVGGLGKAVFSTQQEGQRDESPQGSLQKISKKVVEEAQKLGKRAREDLTVDVVSETNPGKKIKTVGDQETSTVWRDRISSETPSERGKGGGQAIPTS